MKKMSIFGLVVSIVAILAIILVTRYDGTNSQAGDSTVPMVSSTIPADSTIGIAVNSTIAATFSEKMDPLTLTTATFNLMQGTTSVSGAVTYAGVTATFTPEANLAPSAEYTATITTGAKDMTGNALAVDEVWTFTTGATLEVQAPVDLGSAANFAILAKSGISTNCAGITTVIGDIGLSPAAAVYITGFGLTMDASDEFSTSSLVTGNVYAADNAVPTPDYMATAVSDMETAYADAAGRTSPTATELGAGNIGGMTLAPGLYKWSTEVTIPADITLSGSEDDVWIFQIEKTLTVGDGVHVNLIGGAQAKNIFWQVAEDVALGKAAVFNGNILSQTLIAMNTGAALNGRALAQIAVVLDASAIVKPASERTPSEVTTNNASDITTSSATLNGDLTSLGTATLVNVSFEYGATSAYGKSTPAQAKTATGTFDAPISGLLPGMTWHFRAKVDGTNGVAYGSDMTFTTVSDSTTPYGVAKVAFISARDGNEEIYAVTPDNVYLARLTDNAFKESWPRFLADFSRITFTSWRDGNAEVYVMYPDGTIQTRLTNNAAFDGMSDFSWDGSKIAFVSDRDDNYEIYVMNADGSGQTQLTNNADADIMPAFSPDGTRIAFASNRTGNYEIYLMNADGTGTPTQLTATATDNNYPSWLNTGDKISFSSLRDGNSEIYVMNADGTSPVRMTDNADADDQPAWCPTGTAIFFTSWRNDNIPQVFMLYGLNQTPFTSNPEGNWSRANWTAPDTSSPGL